MYKPSVVPQVVCEQSPSIMDLMMILDNVQNYILDNFYFIFDKIIT